MCVEPVTLQRRATDHGEPTNREILAKLEEFMAEHRRDHMTIETRLASHDTAAALREARISDLQRVATEISSLHDFKVQVQTISAMTKWILGGSLLAALAAIASLVATFGHIIQAGT